MQIWECRHKTKGYTGANCGGRIRIDFLDAYPVVFAGLTTGSESQDFLDAHHGSRKDEAEICAAPDLLAKRDHSAKWLVEGREDSFP